MTLRGQRVSIYLILSILLLLVAATLRFHDLSKRSLWLDEAAVALNSQGSLRQMVDLTRHRNSSPIAFPLLLHAVQKIGTSARSVRLPSAVFSLLAVLVMLMLPRVGTNRQAAFIAATVLTLSASQIRYAQEVREYSLSVLLASLMIYGLLNFLNSEGRRRAFLYATLFAAPLAQYGLVLFGFSIIGTLAFDRMRRHKPFIGDAVRFGLALTTSGLISLVLTLRFQLQISANNYLHDFFFNGRLTEPVSMVTFLAGNTYSLFKYLMLGDVVAGMFLLSFAVYCFRFITEHRDSCELPLFLSALTIAVLAALVHAYPYGAIRQCLYLAPVTALAFGNASVCVASPLKNSMQLAWTGVVMSIVLISGLQMLKVQNPYRDIEDINSVLACLDKLRSRDDAVYIYPGARPALQFYGISADRFVYGEHYPQVDLEAYREEIRAAMQRGTGRLWIVLSHIMSSDVENLIVSEMPREWHIEKLVDGTQSSLYLAIRPEE